MSIFVLIVHCFTVAKYIQCLQFCQSSYCNNNKKKFLIIFEKSFGLLSYATQRMSKIYLNWNDFFLKICLI